jgi:hypothetical protein
MTVDRLQLSPVLRERRSIRAAEIAANAAENKRGNRPVSPSAPFPAQRLKGSR